MNLDPLIRACQKIAGADDDGRPGPETWAKIYKKLAGRDWEGAALIEEKVDPRSETTISTLLPEVQPYARSLVKSAARNGILIKIISGLRTYEEQDALFAKGGVTKARGGYSNHNFGIAFDIGIFNGAKYVEDSPLYKAVGALGLEIGLDWGGNWKSIVDEPHFQLRPYWAVGMRESEMLSVLRKRKERKTPVFQ